MQPVRQGRRGGFFDDPGHVDPGLGKGPDRFGPLPRIEFGRDTNDGRFHIGVSHDGIGHLQQVMDNVGSDHIRCDGEGGVRDPKFDPRVVVAVMARRTIVDTKFDLVP